MLTIKPTTKYEYLRHVDINEPAIRNMVGAIVAEPEQWDQNYWSSLPGAFIGREVCGTAWCAAGHAVHQAGYVITYANRGLGEYCHRPETPLNLLQIGTTAQNLLGFTQVQATKIFFFTRVEYGNDDFYRLPTVEEFVQRVADVTGLEFKIPS